MLLLHSQISLAELSASNPAITWTPQKLEKCLQELNGRVFNGQPVIEISGEIIRLSDAAELIIKQEILSPQTYLSQRAASARQARNVDNEPPLRH